MSKFIFLLIAGLLISFMFSMDVSANNNDGGLFIVTASRLHLRAGPSTEHSSQGLIDRGTTIQVTQYVPGGFSSVVYGNLTGYVSSEWIQRLSQNETSEMLPQIITAVPLNLRSGPSLEDAVLTVIPRDTPVLVLNYNPSGFSRVVHDNQTGYVYTHYTLRADGSARTNYANTTVATVAAVPSMTRVSSSNGAVELMHWSDMRRLIPNGTFIEVLDVRTGTVYIVRAMSVGGHADVEPISRADTDAVRTAAGGRWSWDARPVIVTINGRNFAAAIHSMPHAGSTIQDNGMDGHICLHFLGVTTRNLQWTQSMQDAVLEAYRWARANGR